MLAQYRSIQAEDRKFTNLSNLPIGKASAPATCGELIQGHLDGQDFLINSPIDFYSSITVKLIEKLEVRVQTVGHFEKVTAAVRRTLDVLNLRKMGAIIRVDSEIPRGKGLASSTSEIAAAIYATARASQIPISLGDVAAIVIAVDQSSDGVFLSGITRCNHLTGTLIESYGRPPPLGFVIVDCGGHVDTMGFDRERARKAARKHADKLRHAVSLLGLGFASKDCRLVATACTLSSEINQEVILKPELLTLLNGTAEFGGLGVNCAHSGTVLGVMFDHSKTNGDSLSSRVGNLVGSDRIIGVYSLIEGGVTH